jgi:hypothetical protein
MRSDHPPEEEPMNAPRLRPPTIALAAALAAAPALAQEAPKERASEGVGLTVYSAPTDPEAQPQPVFNPRTQQWEQPLAGSAIVKEWRKLKLDAGRNVVRFTDVAEKIDATTVHFRSITDPAGTTVLEQNFEYDLVSADKILAKYIDREIRLTLESEEKHIDTVNNQPVTKASPRVLVGTLLSFDAAQIVLKTNNPQHPIEIVTRGGNVRGIAFSELPGGLITKPTLVWLVDAKDAGEQLANVTYETAAVSWEADYTAVVAKDDRAIDLSAWVTITNQSGATYKDAELKLVAGDVHRAPRPGPRVMAGAVLARADERGRPEAFTEKAFFEYHLYTLARPTTIAESSVKQIELFHPVERIPARKIYLYYGGVGFEPYGGEPYMDRNFGLTSNKKVDIYLEFKNAQEAGLGIPLPAGRVRVHKRDDADGSLELVGEDRIDHTPRDEKVLLKLGSAFDVVGERKQTDFQEDVGAHWVRESFEIRIRNHKAEDIDVVVKENLYRWVNWEIEKKSHDFEKQDARTVHFPVKVPRDGETVLTYTVKYSW